MAKENEMFVGFIIFAIVSTAVGLMVTIPQPKYEVARGDNVTLPCSFKPAKANNPIVIVSWSSLSEVKLTPVATYYHPSGMLDIPMEYEGTVSMKRDIAGGAVDLYLTRVTLKENKVFECEVKIPNDDAGTLAATTRLVVLESRAAGDEKVPGIPSSSAHGASGSGRVLTDAALQTATISAINGISDELKQIRALMGNISTVMSQMLTTLKDIVKK